MTESEESEKRKQRAARWETLTGRARPRRIIKHRVPLVRGTTADGKTVGQTFETGFRAFTASAMAPRSADRAARTRQDRSLWQSATMRSSVLKYASSGRVAASSESATPVALGLLMLVLQHRGVGSVPADCGGNQVTAGAACTCSSLV